MCCVLQLRTCSIEQCYRALCIRCRLHGNKQEVSLWQQPAYIAAFRCLHLATSDGKKSSPSTTSAQTRAAFTVPPPAGWVGHSPSTSTSGNSAPTLPCCKSPGPPHGCSLALQPCPVLLQCAVPAAALHHCCFPLQPSEPRLTLPLALSLRFGFGTLFCCSHCSRPGVLAPLTCAVCAA